MVADEPSIVVVGTGVAVGVPDQCVIHLALNATADTAALALDHCAEAAEQAISALVEAGIDHGDFRTTNLAVQDFYDQSKQKVTARIASYRMEVVVSALDDVGDAVAALATAVGDALQIQSMQLVVSNPAPLQQEARRLAVLNAQTKARELAQAANVSLGAILSIEEIGRNGRPIEAARAMSAGVTAAASLPVEAGEVSTSCSVVITYAIDR